MFCQCPGDLGGVVTNGAGHQTQQLHRPGPLLVPGQCVNNINTIHVTSCHTVPGDVELVNVGDWTQAPELEVHLVLVLAGAGDDVVGDAGPVLDSSCVASVSTHHYLLPLLPPLPHGDEDPAVVGVAAPDLAADAEVHLLPREVMPPVTLGLRVTGHSS